MFLAGLALGILVSLSRISSGAHFFSDTVVSFFVMLIVADVLFFYLILMDGRGEATVSRNLLRPVYVTVASGTASSAAKH